MKRNRIIWIVLLVLSIVAISFYGGVVSFGFFYTMLLVPVVSLLYLLYVFIFFRIYQYNDGRQIVVDDPLPYSFKLINEFHLPFVGIRVRFFSPFSTINELSDKTEYELMPHTGITRETTIVCHYRGEYEIGIKEVEVQDYFRLFKIKYLNRESKRVTINPKLVLLENLGSFEMHSQDAMNNLSKLDIVSREYIPGDDVRFINWSQTARTGKLMSRDRIGEEGNGVAIIMDSCRYSADPYVYLPVENKLLELTLAISLYFCNKSIASNEYHFYRQLISQLVENKTQFEDFYKQMSSLIFDSANTQQKLFENLLRDEKIFSSAVVYMILPVWSEYASLVINKLSERNIYTVVYIISDDTDIKPHVPRADLVDIIVISPEAKLEEVLS